MAAVRFDYYKDSLGACESHLHAVFGPRLRPRRLRALAQGRDLMRVPHVPAALSCL
ncbi:uncharacterized protein SETTUDRAFT_160859 [Exserohilum turcica Et28A]|uniref:Uncharacterized protein n=1 Tax=Exserohilum turcicum (strain 28A) TaxID=671987 RepID=R0K4E7_EXST2|nr:uncharacterized protein SETTUDRAFT_160859 [Exserohilum turcica Et28A]EOA87958.1 hypothetical protein SETTUDRAFT_160859 [Exserohilum turcica Et28A]